MTEQNIAATYCPECKHVLRRWYVAAFNPANNYTYWMHEKTDEQITCTVSKNCGCTYPADPPSDQ